MTHSNGTRLGPFPVLPGQLPLEVSVGLGVLGVRAHVVPQQEVVPQRVAALHAHVQVVRRTPLQPLFGRTPGEEEDLTIKAVCFAQLLTN